MAHFKPRPATYAHIEALPPHVTGEIAYGVLHTMGRPLPRNSRASGALSYELGGPFDFRSASPGGWVFLVLLRQ